MVGQNVVLGFHGNYSSGGRVDYSYNNYLSNWTYVVLGYNSSTSTHSIYLNGSLLASSVNSNAPQSTQTGIDIGAWRSGGFYFEGSIGEFRVSVNTRSSDWIATEYNNQSDPTNFYTVGSPTVNGLGGSLAPYIAELSPASGPVTTSVTILGANFGTAQGSSTVTFNGSAGSCRPQLGLALRFLFKSRQSQLLAAWWLTCLGQRAIP